MCESEEEARELVHSLPEKRQWPCLFTPSDTTGEKDFEEFFTENEVIDLDRFQNLGIVKNEALYDQKLIQHFTDTIASFKQNRSWTKEQLVKLFFEMIPNFDYIEKGKYLDAKM